MKSGEIKSQSLRLHIEFKRKLFYCEAVIMTEKIALCVHVILFNRLFKRSSGWIWECRFGNFIHGVCFSQVDNKRAELILPNYYFAWSLACPPDPGVI